ncbi:hypothetical protein BZA70DRAFT_306413 [Myxozyma melibiosi]|uniref:NUC153 domain-containing protein n=1 Tax=Myxozyma melibiosi TaxID=54550 RepID=A0ABR1FAE5_9ASCO
MVKRKSTAKDGGGDRPKKPITTDPRFSVVHSDPRFAQPKRKDKKIELDSRFKDRLKTDKEFTQKRVVDRYGRKVDKDVAKTELKKYYRMEDSDEEEEEVVVEDEDEEEEEDASGIGAVLEKGFDPARGEGLESSSDEEETDEEVDEEEDVFESTTQEESIPRGDESSRIAAVNMDWDNIRAEDLMVAFASFAHPGKVLSVTIYPSEFGKERMAREEIEGPPTEIFKKGSKVVAGDDEDEIEDEEITEKNIVKEDTGEDFDGSKLRKYQLQRLRYYYAVIVCDSVSAARRIYDGCDGTEYESTANFFDLRYIPDGVEFDDKPKEVCTKLPSVYRPNDFVTDALQHSKVKLTWDETPNERLQFARRAFSRREIEEMDFKAYVASDSEDGEDEFGEGEDKDKLREKYRALLLESKDNSGFDSKDEVDMEVTFTPGLTTEAEAEPAQVEESTIEKYKRKERERRQKRMERNKDSAGVAEESADDDSEIEAAKGKKDKKGKKKAVKKTKEEQAEEERRKAELELLMMGEDEESNLKHFDMREIIKAEKQKKNKKVRRREKEGSGGAAAADEFKINVEDPRFSAVFEHHEFAIDPSKPQFKETTAMKSLLDERRRRTKKQDSGRGAPEE